MPEQIFFPFVQGARPERKLPKPERIGVQIEGSAFNQARWLGAKSVVKLRVRWDEIEYAAGVYFWDDLDREITSLAGQAVIFGVIGTPKDCRVFPPAICSAPMLPKVYRLVDFIKTLVKRYHPLAVELWNEPEASAQTAKAAGLDQLLGGYGIDLAELYGKTLRQVGEMMRKQLMQTWLLAGGLMLNDPEMKFWKAARKRCVGWYDAVSFHAYVNYYGGNFDLIGKKASWLRSIKGAAGERVWVTETALMVADDSPAFRERQAAYLDYLAGRLAAWKVHTAVWYPLANNGWQCTDLVASGVPQPAWARYKVLAG